MTKDNPVQRRSAIDPAVAELLGTMEQKASDRSLPREMTACARSKNVRKPGPEPSDARFTARNREADQSAGCKT